MSHTPTIHPTPDGHVELRVGLQVAVLPDRDAETLGQALADLYGLVAETPAAAGSGIAHPVIGRQLECPGCGGRRCRSARLGDDCRQAAYAERPAYWRARPAACRTRGGVIEHVTDLPDQRGLIGTLRRLLADLPPHGAVPSDAAS